MWHVALQCHAARDILLTFPLFSYCCEVVQNVSQLTEAEYVCYEGVYCSCNIYSTQCIEFWRYDGIYKCVLYNYVPAPG
jgi:hypothetical protein